MGTARAVKAPHNHNQLCIHCSAAFIKHQVPFCSQEGEDDFKKENKAPLHGSTPPRSWRMNLQPKPNLEQHTGSTGRRRKGSSVQEVFASSASWQKIVVFLQDQQFTVALNEKQRKVSKVCLWPGNSSGSYTLVTPALSSP